MEVLTILGPKAYLKIEIYLEILSFLKVNSLDILHLDTLGFFPISIFFL